jgi:hypothetical protein
MISTHEKIGIVSLELCHIKAPERIVPLTQQAPIDRSRTCFAYDQNAIARLQLGLGALEQQIRQRFALDDATAIVRMALLDDVLAREEQNVSINNSWRHELFIQASLHALAQGVGGEAYQESDFRPQGKILQESVRLRAGQLKPENHASRVEINTSHGKIAAKIAGFTGVEDATCPSCAILDLAWTQWRTTQHEQVFTVLPIEYKEQQLQVAALAALIDLPKRDSIWAIFVDPQNSIVEELNYGYVRLL